jgi:HD-like signal output (HDOD) protein
MTQQPQLHVEKFTLASAFDATGTLLWEYFATHPTDVPALRGHSARVLGIAGQIMTIDIAELILLVRADPTSSAELLRVANSPMFFRSTAVASIDEAIIRLGRREVYNVLTTVAARSLFKPQLQSLSALMPQVWWQVQYDAVACAFTSSWLAHSLRLDDYEGAFMLGLFAQVGRLGALFALGHLILQEHIAMPADVLSSIDAQTGLTARITAHMLRAWQLPQGLIDRCQALAAQPGLPLSAPKTLHCVRLIQCMQAQEQTQPLPAGVEGALHQSRQALGLAETQLAQLQLHMSDVGVQVRQLLGQKEAL